MNPRGRQFALGGTLSGWTRLEHPTTSQARLLRRAYAGREPRTFSRYGLRQWAAPLPRTRVIVKDPFAMLSLATIGELTGAVPVLIVRHPAAVLASYRRMSWSPDIDEIVALGADPPTREDDVAAMAAFWSYCHETALYGLTQLARGVVVDHEELSGAGKAGVDRLAARLGLAEASATAPKPAVPSQRPRPRTADLHDFERRPDDIARTWRAVVSSEDVAAIERATATTRRRIDSSGLKLTTSSAHTRTGNT